jgi:hypothetical protein
MLANQAGDKKYLFSATYKNCDVDFCKECMTLLQAQQWDKIGERAHDVLLLRLGVPRPTTG